jgi:hypothetical protein
LHRRNVVLVMEWRQAGEGPAGTRPTSGVVHKRSPLSVAETVERLPSAIRAAGNLESNGRCGDV